MMAELECWDDFVREVKRSAVTPDEWTERWVGAYPSPERVARMIVREAVDWGCSPREFLEAIYESRETGEGVVELLHAKGYTSKFLSVEPDTPEARRILRSIEQESRELIRRMEEICRTT
jgi:hypothetical protein